MDRVERNMGVYFLQLLYIGACACVFFDAALLLELPVVGAMGLVILVAPRYKRTSVKKISAPESLKSRTVHIGYSKPTYKNELNTVLTVYSKNRLHKTSLTSPFVRGLIVVTPTNLITPLVGIARL